MSEVLKGVRPVYQQALGAAAARTGYEGVCEPSAGHSLVEATEGAMTVAMLVDRSTHVITRVRYQRPASTVDQGLLETLCATLTGVTVREAADHGVVVAEHALRDKSQPRPVAGIVMPNNADPMFRSLVGLVRQLVTRYEALAGKQATENFFERPLAAEWLALTDDARRARVQAAITDLAAGVGSDVPVTVSRIDEFVRVTVSFEAPVPGPVAQERLMQLERGLKVRVLPALSLYLEELKDRNVIRNLVTPKETA